MEGNEKGIPSWDFYLMIMWVESEFVISFQRKCNEQGELGPEFKVFIIWITVQMRLWVSFLGFRSSVNTSRMYHVLYSQQCFAKVFAFSKVLQVLCNLPTGTMLYDGYHHQNGWLSVATNSWVLFSFSCVPLVLIFCSEKVRLGFCVVILISLHLS